MVNDENGDDALDAPFIAVSIALIVGSLVLAAFVMLVIASAI